MGDGVFVNVLIMAPLLAFHLVWVFRLLVEVVMLNVVGKVYYVYGIYSIVLFV